MGFKVGIKNAGVIEVINEIRLSICTVFDEPLVHDLRLSANPKIPASIRIIVSFILMLCAAIRTPQ